MIAKPTIIAQAKRHGPAAAIAVVATSLVLHLASQSAPTAQTTIDAGVSTHTPPRYEAECGERTEQGARAWCHNLGANSCWHSVDECLADYARQTRTP